MPVERAMTCEEVHHKLRSFLEDLLSDDEYRAMTGHLGGCPACEKHVRSFGDMTNQVWRLGKVEVPEDFTDTVLYKLKHYRPPEAKTVRSAQGRNPARVAAAVLAVIALAAAVVFFPKPPGPPPALVPESQPAARSTPELVPEPAVEPAAVPAEVVAPEPEPIPVARHEAPASVPKALHWHVTYAPETGVTELQRHSQKILDTLGFSGVQMVSQPSDMVVFAGGGEALERAFEGVLTISQPLGGLKNYTTHLLTSPEKDRTASIYLEKNSSRLHWHVRLVQPSQKERFMEAVQEAGGSVQYDSAGLAVLTAPKTELSKLRVRLQSMRMELSEFGAADVQDNVLTNAAVRVSVWFLY